MCCDYINLKLFVYLLSDYVFLFLNLNIYIFQVLKIEMTVLLIFFQEVLLLWNIERLAALELK